MFFLSFDNSLIIFRQKKHIQEIFTCLFSNVKDGRTPPWCILRLKICFAFTDTKRLFDRFNRTLTKIINSQYSKNNSLILIFIYYSNIYTLKQHFPGSTSFTFLRGAANAVFGYSITLAHFVSLSFYAIIGL